MNRTLMLLVILVPSCGGGGGGGGGGTPAGGGGGGGGGGTTGAPVYPGAGTGTHYWIDGATGSDSNPGTSALPWATVDRVESATLAPGDLVHVLAGTYNLSTNLALTGKTGTASAWIGLQAEGAVVLRNSAVQNVIDVSNCHYLFIKGFEITHDNGGAAYGSWAGVDGVKFQGSPSDHVSIDSCTLHSLGNVGVSSQVSLVTDITVWNCHIYNCYTGLYWGYYEDVNKRYAHYGRIANNYIHDCPPVDLDGTGYGMQIKGGSRGNVIEDNVFVNCGGNTRASIAVYHISTDVSTESDRNIVRRNFVRASRNEGIFAVEGALIENNIVVSAAGYGINVQSRNTGSWGTFYGNLDVRHNTVFGSSGTGMRVGSGAFTPPVNVGNNLSIMTSGTAFWGPAGFTGSASQNFVVGATSGSGLDYVPTTTAAVQSTTYGSANFLFPAAGGALVNGGDAAFAAADDFNGTARAGTPDAGAYDAAAAANPGWTLADGFKP